MTTPPNTGRARITPGRGTEERIPLYTTEFAAHPHRVYREMRERHGSLVPVELAPGVPATLVIGYRSALQILNDPERFPADPRSWQKTVAEDCPVLPVLQWRPNAPRNSGDAHIRYRRATTAALDGVDLHTARRTVEQFAIPLINKFCAVGQADLVREYAFPLTFEVINAMLGCPPELSERAAAATAAVFDGVHAEEGNRMFGAAVADLVDFKRSTPGDDITTRLLNDPADFDEEEMVHQVLSLYGVGMGPMQSLVINALSLMLTDDRIADDMLGGAVSTRDALDDVLFDDPPLPNSCVTYPRRPVLIGDTWLPPDQPVVISLAGCNSDPEIRADNHTGNRAHLAWGAGPHTCPAQHTAYVVAQEAIDQLLDALPELRLAIPVDELTWRPGPMHHTLAALPVTFPPSPPLPLP